MHQTFTSTNLICDIIINSQACISVGKNRLREMRTVCVTAFSLRLRAFASFVISVHTLF